MTRKEEKKEEEGKEERKKERGGGEGKPERIRGVEEKREKKHLSVSRAGAICMRPYMA